LFGRSLALVNSLRGDAPPILNRMVQQKKPLVREAILEGAFRLFSKHGYAATTLAAIAKSADVSPGNVYIYFGSKLEILYAIYDPWLRTRIQVLEEELATLRAPRTRLKRLLVALWRDIPAEENGFLNNIMQAISVTDPSEGYRSTLVQWLEERISGLLMDALPPDRRVRLRKARLAHVIIMAFDGFAIHRHLHPRENPIDDVTIGAVAEMLAGAASTTAAPPRRGDGTSARPRKKSNGSARADAASVRRSAKRPAASVARRQSPK
jgi:AcrR family transcriptional regulator